MTKFVERLNGVIVTVWDAKVRDDLEAVSDADPGLDRFLRPVDTKPQKEAKALDTSALAEVILELAEALKDSPMPKLQALAEKLRRA